MNTLKLKTQLNHKSTSGLNHYFLPSRRSRALAQALPTRNKRWNSSSQTEGKPQTKPAFTIIEVVLVLAIAGLIFLMVFIALPALQRNQRDTQRKNDIDRFLTAVQNYQSNNKGVVPEANGTALHSLKQSYLNESNGEFKDPDGSTYVIVSASAVGSAISSMKDSSNNTLVYYYKNAECSNETTKQSNGSNKVAIAMKLEGGGVYCVNN